VPELLGLEARPTAEPALQLRGAWLHLSSIACPAFVSPRVRERLGSALDGFHEVDLDINLYRPIKHSTTYINILALSLAAGGLSVPASTRLLLLVHREELVELLE